MSVVKFMICLPEEEYSELMKVKDKHYQGKRSPAVADGVRLLLRKYKGKRKGARLI